MTTFCLFQSSVFEKFRSISPVGSRRACVLVMVMVMVLNSAYTGPLRAACCCCCACWCCCWANRCSLSVNT